MDWKLGLVSVFVLAVFASLAPIASATEYSESTYQLGVGDTAPAGVFTLKLTEISGGQGMPTRATLQVLAPDGSIYKQLTFDVPSSEIYLVPEAYIYVTPEEVFEGGYGQPAWVKIRVKIGLVSSPTPTATATTSPPCLESGYTDGTYTFCIGSWVRANNGYYVKLQDVATAGGGDTTRRAMFYIYDSNWNWVASLNVNEGATMGFEGLVSIHVSDITGETASTVRVTASVSSATPTATAVPTQPPCFESGAGEGTYTFCVNSWVKTNNGYFVRLQGVGWSPGYPPQATFGIFDSNWNALSYKTLYSGESAYDSRTGISIYAEEVHGGEGVAFAWARAKVSTISPTVTKVPDVRCQDYYGDGTQPLCVNNYVTAYNGAEVRLIDLSGFGYQEGKEGSKIYVSPVATYQVRYGDVVQVVKLSEGQSQVVGDGKQTVYVYVEKIFPGAFGQTAYAITTVKSVSKPVPTPVIGLQISPAVNVRYDGSVEFLAKVFDDSGRPVTPEQGGSVYVTYRRVVYEKPLPLETREVPAAAPVKQLPLEQKQVTETKELVRTSGLKVLSFAEESGAGGSGGSASTASAEQTVAGSSGGGGSATVGVAIAVPVKMPYFVGETVELKYDDGIWKGYAYGLSGYYTAEFTAKTPSSYASATTSFYVAGEEPPIPPFPYEGEEYAFKLAAGWNLFSVPVYGEVYPPKVAKAGGGSEAAGKAVVTGCAVREDGTVVCIAPSSAGVARSPSVREKTTAKQTAAKVISFEAAASSAGGGGGGSASVAVPPAAAGGSGGGASAGGFSVPAAGQSAGSEGAGGFAVPEVQTAVTVALRLYNGAVVESTDCPQATLWHYDTQQKRYTNAGRLREGEIIQPGKAYWVRVKSGSACKVVVRGQNEYSLEGKELFEGWNQLGGPRSPVSWEEIKGSCSVRSGPWKWNNYDKKYERVKMLAPGEGYFVKVEADCTLGSTWSDEEIPPLPEG